MHWEIKIDIYTPLGIKLADFMRKVTNILGEEASIKGIRAVRQSGGDAAATTDVSHIFCLTQLSLWTVAVSGFSIKDMGLQALSVCVDGGHSDHGLPRQPLGVRDSQQGSPSLTQGRKIAWNLAGVSSGAASRPAGETWA